ncbi:hypothetical protein [Neisseria lactamica]|nr:hypothetical protein [Neisseria meningitidis]
MTALTGHTGGKTRRKHTGRDAVSSPAYPSEQEASAFLLKPAAENCKA